MGENNELQLFAVYLGGDPSPGRLSEDHEVVLVVSENPKQARKDAKEKWGGSTRPHVDGIRAIRVVDGYRIVLEETNEDEVLDVDTTFDFSDG